ncbi:MAG: signal peptidase [Sphingobacterium sp.]
MNRYLLRGLVTTLLGIAGVYWGFKLMGAERELYKLVLTLGVILFGIGFITLIYRVFRRMDRSTLLEERKGQKK